MVALSATQTHAHNRAVLLPFTLAAPALDLLILIPTRPTAYRTFALTAALTTWSLYIAITSAAVGHLPTTPELWTGLPLTTAVTAWHLTVVLLPLSQPSNSP